MNKLEQLKKYTDVVADTGDIEAIKRYQPLDATTNPSLLFKAAQMEQYQDLVKDSINQAKATGGSSQEQLDNAIDQLAVDIGTEILNIVPGRVSTEVDARLSFDQAASLDKARKLINLYADKGFDKNRILIKLASTWEGIRAAEILEKEGINCNLTLMFSLNQAAACADAGAFLISPFVGRILDWYKKESGRVSYPANEDPGVISVTQIYNYYKQHNYKTVVMGASFRNTGEIEQLAGCDRLTISPGLLEELSNDQGSLERILNPDKITEDIPRFSLSEAEFRLSHASNAMANEKLAQGIRGFIADTEKLENYLISL